MIVKKGPLLYIAQHKIIDEGMSAEPSMQHVSTSTSQGPSSPSKALGLFLAAREEPP